jgi:spore photoproduct lyase
MYTLGEWQMIKQCTLIGCEPKKDGIIYISGATNLIDVKVKTKKYDTLDGKQEERVSEVGDGSIIKMFEKTPTPSEPWHVVCPKFLELKWANGCYFDCAWCYLKGTYRFYPEWVNGKPNIKDFNTIELHLKALLSRDGRAEILNAGEICDSLLAENEETPFSRFIVNVLDKYDKFGKYKVLFLTKSPNVKNLLELKRPDRIIMSFSMNAFEVARKWERAPSVEARIDAAKKVYEVGYTTRIRIDPMVPIEGWKERYLSLIDRIFSKLIPERITIGSLRGLSTTILNAKDKSWVIYLTEESNWGKKIDFNIRLKMYSTVIEYLRSKYEFDKIALCKETIAMWNKLKIDYRKIKCNCTL